MKAWILAAGTLAVGLVIGLAVGLSLRPRPPSPGLERAEVVLSRVVRPSDPSPADTPDDVRPVRPEDTGRPAAVEVAEPEAAGGTPWVLSDRDAGVEALRAVLEGAGLTLDEAQIRALTELAERVAPEFLAASDAERTGTERMALRRTAEVLVERGLAEILHSGQVEALEQALGRRAVVETLPGGEERDTMSSTGVDRARAATMVLSSYQRRLEMTGDPHPGVGTAIESYVGRVEEINRSLEARWGRGFMEAVASGPTPHTEAARRAREEPGHAVRELEARAELWRAQAALEREMAPYLDDAARALLRTSRPTALRILLESD